jgi:N-acetylmuramoyl-L-alanine amidase
MMINGSEAGESVVALVFTAGRLLIRFFLWLLLLVVAPALTASANAFATAIRQVTLGQIGNAVEIEFHLRGLTPRWRLQTHHQELWLDLDNSHLDASAELSPVPIVFPLTRVSMRDFGAGQVRLVIHVRGQVDYAVAQMPQLLVVRIAKAGQGSDLAGPLWSEMERSRDSPVNVASATHRPRRRSQTRTPTVPNSSSTSDSVMAMSLPLGADSGISRSNRVSASIPPPNMAIASETGNGNQTMGTAVQPVANRVARGPLTEQEPSSPIVVIDAGHGGFDPGTESTSGIAEKTVALAITLRVAAALEARGIHAALTRDDDRFLSLAERTELANRAHVNLFVSIHLNSSPNWNTSGIETYYLNNTTDRATIRLARMENGSAYSVRTGANLNYILTNLRQDYKAHESSSLAWMIEAGVTARINSMLGIRVNALGAKMGPFYVLVGAEMPSVLIECGFLSNSHEAQLLTQPAYQDALAGGIAEAIMHYFNADVAVGNL